MHQPRPWQAATASRGRPRAGPRAPLARGHAAAPRPRNRGLPLRGWLLLLVVASVLPVVAFGLGDAYLTYRAARAEAGRRTLDLARGLALAVERDIEGRLAALRVLALSRTLREGDTEGFRPVAEATLAEQMPGANILVLRQDGQQLLNTASPPGEPLLARRDTTTLRRLFATGEPSVSDVFVGVTLRRPLVALEVPVLGSDGKVAYGLTLNPTTDAFDLIIRRHRLPETWIVSLYDRRGAFVARSRDTQRFVGQSAGPVLLPRLTAAQREGVLETDSQDGVPMLAAFSRMESYGWTASVGVPLAELAAPAWRSALRTLASGSAFLLAGLALAHAVGRRITGPIASLRDLAAAPDRDHPPAAPPKTGLAEADEVAEALVAAARERSAAAAALRESEFRLRLALDASQLGTWLWDVGAGGALIWDARCKALFGFPPDAPVDYAAWAGAILPEDRPEAEAGVARALDPADPHDEYACEYRVRHPGGRVLWLQAAGRAIFESGPAAPAGRRAVRILGTILDATERRAAAERQTLLLREVDHRAKNALAVALSLVRLTPRDDAARFAAGVEGRIAAMARAHSLLAEERWSGADLRALAAGELAAYADRVELQGPPARLSAGAAQPVAMVLHELATNAAKHGALSAPAGRVALSWDFGDAEAGLRLRWVEKGGPAIASPPARRGFGSRLLVSLAERQLGGRLALDWEPTGLRGPIALPPRHAQPAAADAGESAARPAAA